MCKSSLNNRSSCNFCCCVNCNPYVLSIDVLNIITCSQFHLIQPFQRINLIWDVIYFVVVYYKEFTTFTDKKKYNKRHCILLNINRSMESVHMPINIHKNCILRRKPVKFWTDQWSIPYFVAYSACRNIYLPQNSSD